MNGNISIIIYSGLSFIIIFHLFTSIIICVTNCKVYNLKKKIPLISFVTMQILWILAFITIILAPCGFIYDFVLWKKYFEKKQKHVAEREKLNKIQDLEKQFLDEIQKDNPNYSLENFKERIKNIFSLLNNIRNTKDINKLQLFLSDAVYSHLIYQNLSQKLKDKYLEIKDIRAVKLERFSEYYLTSFNIVFVSKLCDDCSEIWTFLKKANTNQINKGLIEGFCPNCGNSIEELSQSICQSCKAFLKSGEYDWILIRIESYSNWNNTALPNYYKKPVKLNNLENTPYSEILDLKELKEKDPNFSILNMSDKLALLFWQIILFTINNDYSSLKILTSEEVIKIIEKNKSLFPDLANNLIININRINIIGYFVDSVNEQDLLIGEIYWSVFESFSSESSFHKRSVLFLRRENKTTSDISDYYSSLHCHNCGALVKDSDNICYFCFKPIKANNDWVLTNIYNCNKAMTIEKLIKEIYGEENEFRFNKIKMFSQEYLNSVNCQTATDWLDLWANRLNESYYRDKTNFKEYYLHKKMIKDMGIKTNQRNSLFSSSKHDYSLPTISEIIGNSNNTDSDK